MSADLIVERIVKLAFTPIAELPAELKRIGLQCEVEEEGHTLIILGSLGRAGLNESDPITKAVQIAFAYCGIRWASFLPNLLPKVQEEWKRQNAKTKNKKAWAETTQT